MILKLPQQIEKYDFYTAKYRDHEGSVKIEKLHKKRTIKQNAFLHVLITLFSIETGYTLDEGKTHLKRNCSFMRYNKNDEVFLKRTRDLDSKQLSDFIEWIRTYAGQKGFYLPTSEDYLRNWEEIEQEIEAHKQFM